MSADETPQWEDDQHNAPVYTPNAPVPMHNVGSDSNAHRNSNIAYDASGKAQFATINIENKNDEDGAGAGAGAVAESEVGPVADNGGETFKNAGNGSNVVYNENNINIGEGVNVNNNNNNNNENYQRLPPWFESTGNASVDYKLARSRFCCCSLRAGIETMGLGVIIISIWDLLISSQFAEEQVLVSMLALCRILGGICGFYGAWKYHKNASLIFFIFWCLDALLTFFLLIYSIYLINHCNNSYDDDDDDWYWWYDDCKYKYENLTGLYILMLIIESYCVVTSRRFYKLMAEI